LRTKLTERGDACNAVAAAEKAHAGLSEELAAAREKTAQARRTMDQAIDAVRALRAAEQCRRWTSWKMRSSAGADRCKRSVNS
jgi:hypothetical protein